MPSVPGAIQSTSVIQNQTTGAVDFLKYSGNQLVASSVHDYGLGSDFKIVASGQFGHSGNNGNSELVAQSQSTGKLDFLEIDASGKLVSSFMTSYSLPTIHGAGYFGNASDSQVGPSLVAQLSDGSIDVLSFDQNHKFIASDLVANSKGLPTLVGAGSGPGFFGPQFQSLGTNNSSLMTQLSDGTLDAIGIGGSFGNLSVVSSHLLSQTQGSAKAYATNVSTPYNIDIPGDNGDASVQVFTQSNDGYRPLYLDSGYSENGNSGTEGALYATNTLQSFAGWNVVDGGSVLFEIYPGAQQPA